MNPIFSDPIILESPNPGLRASPGQFFLAHGTRFDPYLPLVLFPFRFRGEFVESLIVPREFELFARAHALTFRGPYGNPFFLPRDLRRALALATDMRAAAHLIAWLELLVQRGCEVTFLCPDENLPENWLPLQIEYRVVSDIVSEAMNLRSWAEAVYASGDGDFYDTLQIAVMSSAGRIESGRAQILFRDLYMPCGTGLCYACAFRTARGVQLACREGPVLDLADWVIGE